MTHHLILGFNGAVYAVLPREPPRMVGAAALDSTPGAAFFDEDFGQDRVTAYEVFRVWKIA